MRRCGVDLDCYFKVPCLKIERMISGAAKFDSPECLLFIRTLGFPDVRSRPYFIVVMTEILIPFQFTHF